MNHHRSDWLGTEKQTKKQSFVPFQWHWRTKPACNLQIHASPPGKKLLPLLESVHILHHEEIERNYCTIPAREEKSFFICTIIQLLRNHGEKHQLQESSVSRTWAERVRTWSVSVNGYKDCSWEAHGLLGAAYRCDAATNHHHHGSLYEYFCTLWWTWGILRSSSRTAEWQQREPASR